MTGSWPLPQIPTLLHLSPLRNPLAPSEAPLCSGRSSPGVSSNGAPDPEPALSEGDGLGVDAGTEERARTAARRELERVGPYELRAEGECETGAEAVSRAVRIGHGSGDRRGCERASRLRPPAERSRRGHDELRLRIELAGVIRLGLVGCARHDRIQLDSCPLQRGELSRRGHEDTRTTG